MRHIVIFSSGRSGSNRLLDVFDQHELTNCRNEIDADDPQLAHLVGSDISSISSSEICARWEESVRRAAVRKGSRDRHSLGHKRYLTQPLSGAWASAFRRRLARRLLLQSGSDWPIPSILIPTIDKDKIIPVLKISTPPQFFIATHRADPSQILIHNIREPRGMILSWYNRFILPKFGSPEAAIDRVRASANLERAKSGLPPLTQNYSLRSLLVAELWLWRLNNEPLVVEVRDSPRYLRVTYHEMTKYPQETAHRAFEHAGLEFTDTHSERVMALENVLFATPHREALDPVLLQEAIEEALDGSPLAALTGADARRV